MCIRDSSFAWPVAIIIAGLIIGGFAIAESPVEARNRRYDCLLYTSDAADDLLCVDLGGRRIITTKKQHTTNRGITRQSALMCINLTQTV